MAVRRLHVMHASMQFSDTDAQTRSDMKFLFDQKPDVISFTEMGSASNLRMLREVGNNHGYRLYAGEAGHGLKSDDCCAAVRVEKGRIGFLDGGHVYVHPGQYNQPEHEGGRYGPKGITWVKFNFFGVRGYHHVAHWVHNQNEDPLNRQRANELSRAMGEMVARHGRETAISFFGGDMNVDPDAPIFPHEIFENWKLITIWRDGGQLPTHGSRSIDVLGRYGPDRRVDFRNARIYPSRNSDHRPVSAWYDVDVNLPTRQPGDPTPGDQDPSGDPDGPVYGGPKASNVSWKDYKDNDRYEYPQATDEFDTENG